MLSIRLKHKLTKDTGQVVIQLSLQARRSCFSGGHFLVSLPSISGRNEQGLLTLSVGSDTPYVDRPHSTTGKHISCYTTGLQVQSVARFIAKMISVLSEAASVRTLSIWSTFKDVISTFTQISEVTEHVWASCHLATITNDNTG